MDDAHVKTARQPAPETPANDDGVATQAKDSTPRPPAFTLRTVPPSAASAGTIADLASEMRYYRTLANLMADSGNWPLFFETHHKDAALFESAMAEALSEQFSKTADNAAEELRKLGVAPSFRESLAAATWRDYEQRTRGRTDARQDMEGQMADLRTQIATLGEQLVAAEEARAKAETRARKAAAAKGHATRKAAARKKTRTPARKTARRKR